MRSPACSTWRGKAKDHLMVLNMSGRGDKDLDSVAAFLESKKK